MINIKLIEEGIKQRLQKLILNIKKRNPSVCIGADVIVGFPGEEESDFNETVDFIKSLPLSYLCFSYSERDNTVAKELEKNVPIKRKFRSKV